LCSDLHRFFSKDLKCSSWNETAIKLPVLSERFSRSTSSQYYAYLEDLTRFFTLLNEILCVENKYCRKDVSELVTASYLDIDYDAISGTIVLTAGWPGADEGWSEDITLPSKDATVEIGVLSHEGNADPEDIQFGGFLTVLGQDEHPSMSLFADIQ
jgi:hypothetical protein